jgi:hypothetical protein
MVTKPTRAQKPAARRVARLAAKPRAVRVPKPKKGEDPHDYLIRLSNWIPDEIMATLPEDLASNWHHYAHGGPKQDP